MVFWYCFWMENGGQVLWSCGPGAPGGPPVYHGLPNGGG
jgi:hypothetical protein